MVCTEGVDASACGVDTAAGLSEIGATAGVCVAGTFIGTSGMGVADTTACGCRERRPRSNFAFTEDRIARLENEPGFQKRYRVKHLRQSRQSNLSD